MKLRRNLAIVLAALLCGCAGLAPVSPGDADRKLTEAIERQLPSLASAGDYWAASRVSFQLAGARHRLNDTRGACIALTNSLGYYRRALATEAHTTLYDLAADRENDEGMIEIRSMFGCVSESSARARREPASEPQAQKPRIVPTRQG